VLFDKEADTLRICLHSPLDMFKVF